MELLVCVCPHSVEVVDDIGGIAASKVRHGHTDPLIVVCQVDADVFLQLLAPTQRGVHGFFIKNLAMEQVLPWVLQTHTHTHKSARKHKTQLY